MGLDDDLSTWIYQHVGLNSNPWIANFPYYFGLLPYELYVLPGMFLAIFVMFASETAAPIQFHLLPHWFAYSMSIYLKHNVERTRPGCKTKEHGKRIDPKHCESEPRNQSFPSGHTVIAFSLLIALFLFLLDPSYTASGEKWIFAEGLPRVLVLVVATFIALNVALHRVAFGYHHVSDVCIGAVIGSMIGLTSYLMCNKLRGESWPLSVSDSAAAASAAAIDWKEFFMNGVSAPGVASAAASSSTSSKLWTGTRVVGCVASLVGIWHFFTHSFGKLSELRH